MEHFTAIVLSAGSGTRMKSSIPKQYLPLNGKPVIYYSLKAFEESKVDEIILVTGKDDISYCRTEIVERYHLKKVKAIVAGGKERYESVYCGLCAAEPTDYVLIHDGARPIISQEIIRESMKTVVQEKACIVGVPVKDTIKVVDESMHVQQTLERKQLWQIQTPQSFAYEWIKDAYKMILQKYSSGEMEVQITDDAMVIEYAAACPVKMIYGDYRNLKITTPEDLVIAGAFLGNEKN